MKFNANALFSFYCSFISNLRHGNNKWSGCQDLNWPEIYFLNVFVEPYILPSIIESTPVFEHISYSALPLPINPGVHFSRWRVTVTGRITNGVREFFEKCHWKRVNCSLFLRKVSTFVMVLHREKYMEQKLHCSNHFTDEEYRFIG